MKKKVVVTSLVLIGVILIVACIFLYKNQSQNKETKIYIADKLTNHKKEDVKEAIETLIKDFKNSKTFKNCFIGEISYSNMGAESEERIKKELNVEDVIIIDFKFNTGKNVDQTLTKNEVYRYSATYIKGTNQEWECYEMGHK